MHQPTLQLPSWQMTGIVSEMRQLTTSKTNEVWAYSIKIMATGGTYDLFTRDEEIFKQFTEGETVEARGRLEPYNNGIKLLVTTLVDLNADDSGKNSTSKKAVNAA